MRKTKNRIGEIFYNTYGTPMKIIEYKNSRRVKFEFQDEYKKSATRPYSRLISGKVKNLYDKSVFGVGCLGEGEYVSSINGKLTKIYKTWGDMLRRCYSKILFKKRPSYINCQVCDEWLNFQNFGKWFDENYYTYENQNMQLDKDILFKGNKKYNSQNCLFVPARINTLLLSCNSSRGDLPIGVTKNNNNYAVLC